MILLETVHMALITLQQRQTTLMPRVFWLHLFITLRIMIVITNYKNHQHVNICTHTHVNGWFAIE